MDKKPIDIVFIHDMVKGEVYQKYIDSMPLFIMDSQKTVFLKQLFIPFLLFILLMMGIIFVLREIFSSDQSQNSNRVNNSVTNTNTSSDMNSVTYEKIEPLSDWKEYYNANQGYTIYNPDGWYLYTDTNNPSIDLFLSTDPDADSVLSLKDENGVVIYVETLRDIVDLDAYLTAKQLDAKARLPGAVNEIEEVRLGDDTVKKWLLDTTDLIDFEGAYNVLYYKKLDERFLVFTASARNEDGYLLHKDEIEKIVSTVRSQSQSTNIRISAENESLNSNPQPIDTSLWVPYKNNVFGFKFLYPQSWTVEEKKAKSGFFKTSEDVPQFIIEDPASPYKDLPYYDSCNITFFPYTDPIDIQDWIQQKNLYILAGEGVIASFLENVSVNNLQGVRVNEVGPNVSTAQSFFFKLNKYILRYSYFTGLDIQQRDTFLQYAKICDAIAGTFESYESD